MIKAILTMLVLWAVFAAEASPLRVPGESDRLVSENAELRERLFRSLAAARTETEGRAVEDQIWRFWLDLAPNPLSRALVDEAMGKREAYDFAAAERLLGDALKLAPSYAEAWNQRAFVRFLREEHEGAEADLMKALDLEPQHFGALSGLYHVLLRQGRTEAAVSALEQAVKIHPWLKERSMLPAHPDAERSPLGDEQQDF